MKRLEIETSWHFTLSNEIPRDSKRGLDIKDTKYENLGIEVQILNEVLLCSTPDTYFKPVLK